MKKQAQNSALEAFLADPSDWQQGVRLYEQYGRNEALKAIFARSGETDYNWRKLIEGLEGLALTERTAQSRSGQTRPGTARVHAGTAKYAVPPNHPELIKRYRLRAMWKSQLVMLPTQEERRERAFAILDLTDEIESILYRGITASTVDSGRTAEPKAAELPTDRAELTKRLTNNRKYISKFRHREDKAKEINRRWEENERIETVLTGLSRPGTAGDSPS